jgi:Short C-terminal domain
MFGANRRVARRTARRVSRRQMMMQEAQQPEPQPQAPSRAPPPAASQATDVTAELKRLADLHAQGALSDEEFAAAKAKVLGT